MGELTGDVIGTEKACARCGRSFVCGADEPTCWCDGLRLTDAQRSSLAALRLTGCLCRECLEGIATTT